MQELAQLREVCQGEVTAYEALHEARDCQDRDGAMEAAERAVRAASGAWQAAVAWWERVKYEGPSDDDAGVRVAWVMLQTACRGIGYAAEAVQVQVEYPRKRPSLRR